MRLVLPFLCCFLSLLALSAETPIPASPADYVTDSAGFMSPGAVQTLNQRLAIFERSSGRQVFVYIGKSTGGVPIEDWAVKAFKVWKVGRKGLDDGVALFIMVDDRRIRIEVGYGLEDKLTDALASRIIHDVIQPKILANDADGAVTSGVESIVNVLDDKGLPGATSDTSSTASPPHQKPLSMLQLLFYGILGIAFLALLATHPTLAMYLLVNILSGGRRNSGSGYSGGGFGGGGGGGFGGGGGGRSGGGGATGSW